MVWTMAENRYQRTGTCNLCGMCCGAEYPDIPGYEPHTPWPRDLPVLLRNWNLDDVLSMWPYAVLFGFVTKTGGGVEVVNQVGVARIVGRNGGDYPYVWVKVNGKWEIRKDTSPGGDGSQHSPECPFLKGSPGETERPCALVDTRIHDDWVSACQLGTPPMEKGEKDKQDWENDHPNCSYGWSLI